MAEFMCFEDLKVYQKLCQLHTCPSTWTLLR